VTRILLVGCGKMGGALLAGWLEQGISPSDAIVVDPHYDTKSDPDGVRSVASPEEIPADFAPDVVLLAVKPQIMNQAAPAYRRFAGSAVFLSIAAGRTIASLEAVLGSGAAIVRAMPNTPAAVGRGATGLLANRNVSPAQRATCDHLVTAVGKAVWVAHENQLDAVTALSGSGPAYVFLLVEALTAAGENLGLPAETAAILARETVTGSGELLHQSSLPAAALRENVTSPNGTTYAALQVLMKPEGGLSELMRKATEAACRRAEELAG
jgi:pyrroline-5-carboxylate reductase